MCGQLRILLVPFYEEDGLRMGELARRALLSKQIDHHDGAPTEREGLVRRERDLDDGRAFRIVLTRKARRFEPIAERTVTELGELARQRLGDRRLASLKHDLKDGSRHEALHRHSCVRSASRGRLHLSRGHGESLPNGQPSSPASWNVDGRYKIVNGLGEFFFEIHADTGTGVIDMLAGRTSRPALPAR